MDDALDALDRKMIEDEDEEELCFGAGVSSPFKTLYPWRANDRPQKPVKQSKMSFRDIQSSVDGRWEDKHPPKLWFGETNGDRRKKFCVVWKWPQEVFGQSFRFSVCQRGDH